MTDVFAPQPRAEGLAQGDLLESVEFFQPKQGDYKDVLRLRGLVVSHSCDFTKFRADESKGRDGLDRFPLLVAPVLTALDIPDQGTVGHARSGRVPRYLSLPSSQVTSHEELFVDFWFMQPAAVYELLGSRRLASMTDEWQRYLQRAIDRFFSWEDRKQTLGDPA